MRQFSLRSEQGTHNVLIYLSKIHWFFPFGTTSAFSHKYPRVCTAQAGSYHPWPPLHRIIKVPCGTATWHFCLSLPWAGLGLPHTAELKSLLIAESLAATGCALLRLPKTPRKAVSRETSLSLGRFAAVWFRLQTPRPLTTHHLTSKADCRMRGHITPSTIKGSPKTLH